MAQKNNIDKISREMFTKSEKDKISIEHIFPQTPTNYYWQNMLRQFDNDEKTWLAGALGNLLPLSQSINSSLQNDSFDDKKSPKEDKRRGYKNGSHSEIQVSEAPYWDSKKIFDRSRTLLQFMENRWQFSLTEEQFDKLLYINFVNDKREIPAELPVETNDENNSNFILENILEKKQCQFWTNFVEYCKSQERNDIAARKPSGQNWHDISIGANDFYISYTITRSKYISILIYANSLETFNRLESKKEDIEIMFGNKLDWYSSREKSSAKRIIYKKNAEIFNVTKQNEIFMWMIEKFDALTTALRNINEI